MRYTLSFLDGNYNELLGHLSASPHEQAAYLLCGLSVSDLETRLLTRCVIPVDTNDILEQSPTHMSIRSQSFLRAMKKANAAESCFVFVHSHPAHCLKHSTQDDREERKLFETAYNRIHAANLVHASLVISDPQKPVGRVWLDGGRTETIDAVRNLGRRSKFYFASGLNHNIDTTFHDRQVRAFGVELQPLLKRLTIWCCRSRRDRFGCH